MNHQVTTDPTSHQNAAPQQQVNSALETLLQVVLQEAATAKEATIDALISRFEDITSILKEAKRQRQVKRKYCENDGILDEHKPTLDGDDSKRTLGDRARMPAEVLRQLTQSGFLSTADLAKTLLLTSKCHEIDLGREYVYKYLCRSRWRNITKLPSSLLADRGYYWLFRNLFRPIYEFKFDTYSSIPPPPAFDCDELLFSVSIRDGSGKEIVSEVLCGDQLNTLNQDGTAGIFLEEPIVIGTYPAAPVGAYAGYAERDAVYKNWSVTVHLFRLDQNKCCCVHDSRSCEWLMGEGDYAAGTLTSLAGSPLSVLAFLNSSTLSETLELDEGGKLLERRIQVFDHDPLGDDVHPFQGIRVNVTLNCFIHEQAPPHPGDPSAQTVILKLGEVELEVMRVETHGACNAYDTDPHGVTLLHLLEHLKGWGDPDD
jgi:hypothetical protein